MHFSYALAALAFATTALASSYSVIKADVAQIHTAAVALKTAAESIDGSNLAAALTVQSKFSDLLGAVQKTTSDAKDMSKKFSKRQAHALIASLTSTEDPVKGALQRFTAIASAAKKSGIDKVVVSDLKSAESAVTEAGSALTDKVTDSQQKSRSKRLINRYLSDIHSAMKAYN